MKKTPVMHVTTTGWIAKFYEAVMDGEYRGRKKEREAVEKILLLAAKSGLIKGVPPA